MNANDLTIINCCVCCKEIPLDAAFTTKSAEFVEHFCGLDCYERFQARSKALAETDTTPAAGDSTMSCAVPAALCWELGRRHHIVIGRSALPCW
ncbi:MAG: hypothetical protein BGO99_05750 [Nitrosospira sp. 56-18]|nr:MAG: hypothetical protein BGO99_05750 [Nitrosospira sp. 56-18]